MKPEDLAEDGIGYVKAAGGATKEEV